MPGESVYVLTRQTGVPIPTPPHDAQPRQRHRLAVPARPLAGRAGRGGRGDGAARDGGAGTLLVSDGRVVGVRTGDKGRGPDGEELGNFEPGTDIVAQVTVLAEGTQGHLTGVALDHFGLRPDDPQVWELGVKEVWQVAKPLDRIIHTMGWPLRPQAKYREFGGSFIYPMGDDMLTIGMVVGPRLPRRRPVGARPAAGAQDPSRDPAAARRRRASRMGSQDHPGRRLPLAAAASSTRPGCCCAATAPGMVNIPTLKGVHYAIESGRLAAEAAFASLKAGRCIRPSTWAYDEAMRSSFIWQDLTRCATCASVFGRGFFVGAACAGAMTISKGRISVGKVRTAPDDGQPLLRTGRAARYPAADGKLTFDKLSSVFASGNKTRDDQPNHIRIAAPCVPVTWPRCGCTCVRPRSTPQARGSRRLVTVQIEPSNCVQCGAITAKGGRLTPPEGGSGPEYTQT